MTDIPNRTVEMYRLNPDGRWDTVMVEIPANTETDKIEEVARIHADAQYGPLAYMLYNSMDDECSEVPRRSSVNVVLSFDANQTTVGNEEEQKAAAIDQINMALQREPYGLGAQITQFF